MRTDSSYKIPSVNFHLWEPCNMRCKFCFATFQDVKQSVLPKGHLPKADAIKIVEKLADFGFQKITFAGGEPTLCKWLPDLIVTAKDKGMTTMIVTNGSNLSDKFLSENKEHLDWIAISVDSLTPEVNTDMGRAISGKKPLTLKYYLDLTDRIKKFNYGLKINSVVTSKNFTENISELINYSKPKRWKVLQVLPIRGQNDDKINSLTVSQDQFLHFLNTHNELENITNIIPEANEDMKGSYAMVDPAGRFFDNAKSKHNYSCPILEFGVETAIKQVDYDFDKFIKRGGVYDWKRKTNTSKLTLSGLVGSGKTTIGKLLAKKMESNFISIGDRVRKLAESKSMSILEFQKYCKSNPEMDIHIDQEFSNECNNIDNLVIDYRLGFKFIKDAYHIFLKVSEANSRKRLKKANRINESFENIRERNNYFKNQFFNNYDVDYTLPIHYDLVIDVDKYKSPEEIVDYILSVINR